MYVEIIIPYSPSPDRAQPFDDVTRFLSDHRWEVRSGASEGPFNKGRTVYDLVSASSADFVVIHDADVVCAPGGIRRALQAVKQGVGWAVPHGLVYRVSKENPSLCLPCVWKNLGTPRYVNGLVEREPYQGIFGGGITVLRRETYLDCPIDPRFEEWGQDDESWGVALETLYGRAWRGDAALIHLWHQPQPRATTRWGSEASRRIYQEEYHCWNGNPVEIRKTIDRAKAVLVSSAGT